MKIWRSFNRGASFETSLSIYLSRRRNIPAGSNLLRRQCENLKLRFWQMLHNMCKLKRRPSTKSEAKRRERSRFRLKRNVYIHQERFVTMPKQNGTNHELYPSVTHNSNKSWNPFTYSPSLQVYWQSHHLQV
jgi:hypothetical protein